MLKNNRRRVSLLAAAWVATALASCLSEPGSGNPGAAGTTGGGAGMTGAAGTTAAAGTTGAAGTTAAAGTTGVAGTAAAGTNGAAGTVAIAGTTGAAGTSAAAGRGGTTGTGRGGTTGAAGTGSAGTTGSGGGSAQCPSTATLRAGATTKMLMFGGMQRSYLVYAPASYTGTTPVPVVFDFHGLSGTSSQQRSLSRWDRLADTQNFIAVYPQGVGNSWNAGGCCGNSMSMMVDDVGFVKAIVAALKTDACIDARRVYASGCSNGGAMSYRLACEASDVVAGVAPVDFDCVVGGRCASCMPGRPITVVQFRGTNDTAVPYSGAMPNFTRWGEINMCSGAAMALPANMSCQTYPMCGADAETILCSVQNGSHCGSYNSFMIPAVAWDVLKNHPLP